MHYRLFVAAFVATSLSLALPLVALRAGCSLSVPNSPSVALLAERRASIIVGATTGATSVQEWLNSLQSNGKWPDVDYTTGCNAVRASWPAQKHWQRLVTLAAAWHGGLNNAQQWAKNSTLYQGISSAMDWWFANDFTNPSCLDHGGDSQCPCGTPGMWNTNWFSNVIGIPSYVGQVCVLLNVSLSVTQQNNCTNIMSRSFNTFTTGVNGLGAITGANALDIASIGVDLGILTANTTLLSDAFDKVHKEEVIQNATLADGIRPDGSFGQHAGIIYNGNYGKDYSNDVLNFETEAAGTEFQASDSSRAAFITLWGGNIWMIFRNTLTGVLHWDFSVIGRFIAVPVADDQASQSIKTNVSQIQVLAKSWESTELQNVYKLLSSNTTNANIGDIRGNRMFYANDYMVQRGEGYVSTLRMFSKRTINSECINSQNPLGLHLSDGTLYTYLQGNEYEDISAAWDWNLIPGITVDYNANALNCSSTRHSGTQTLVGGASNGRIGVAAMRYETPGSKTLQWRKAWFFLPEDVQHVMIARIVSATPSPVFSILDQRRLSGDIFVDNQIITSGNFTGVQTLYHGGVGYAFNAANPAAGLSVQSGERTGNWSSISTSKQPPVTVSLFSAWLSHGNVSAPVDYKVFPATTRETFVSKAAASDISVIRNDGSISAVLDNNNAVAMFVFWETAGGSTTIPSVNGTAPIKVTASGNVALIICLDVFNLTVADPTQTIQSVNLTFELGSGTTPTGWGSAQRSLSRSIVLPSGGLNGSSVGSVLFGDE